MGKHHINHGNRERNINLVTRLTWLANKYLPPWLISCGNTNYCKRNSSLKKRHFYQQTQRAGIPKRIQQGVCWYPVSANKSYYNSLNQLIIEIKRDENDDTDHNFEYGRPVCFFRFDQTGDLRYFSFAATISYVHENTMLVVLPNSNSLLDIQGCPDLGVQLYFDGTSYKTMFAALTEVMEAKNNRLARLREAILGNEMVEQRKLQPIHLMWLNHSQEQAVNRVLAAKEVAVVHGPPGTGKTTTLVEAVYETLRRENQVMVCAQSNTAVDWIAEKLLDRGVNVLRIGNPTRVNDKMLSFTYERKFESHPAYPTMRAARASHPGTLRTPETLERSQTGIRPPDAA